VRGNTFTVSNSLNIGKQENSRLNNCGLHLKKSVEVLCKLGAAIQWVHSFIAGDKIYGIYFSPSEELIREHARLAGFPADTITRIDTVIEPATAD